MLKSLSVLYLGSAEPALEAAEAKAPNKQTDVTSQHFHSHIFPHCNEEHFLLNCSGNPEQFF